MKHLLLATATLIGMSAAALAAEPVALTDSQLDNVTAGQTLPGLPALPGLQALPGLPGLPGLPALPGLPGLPALPGLT
jgi:hypothetical protein